MVKERPMNTTEISNQPLLRILLVEDNQHDALAFQQAFTKSHIAHQITHYQRAKEALAQLQTNVSAFDLLVTDYKLPDMSGLELCQELLNRAIALPLVLLTGTGTEYLALEALKAGVDEYLIKDVAQGYLDLLPVVLPQVVQRHQDYLLRLQTEQALRESESRYRALVEKSSDGFYLHDIETGYFLYLNERTCEMFGYSMLEGLNLTILQLLAPEAVADMTSKIQEIAEGKQLAPFTFPALHKEGHTFIVEISPVLVTYQGKLCNQGTLRDITKRKQAEDTLQSSEAELRALFTAMTDIVLVLNRQGRYLKIAPTSSHLLNRSADDLLGKTMLEVWPKPVANRFLDQIQQSLDTNQSLSLDYKLPIRGREVWFEARISPLLEDSVIWIARDITARKWAEEALRESEERFRAIFEQAAVGMSLTTPAGTWLRANQKMCDIVGYTVEELLQKTFQEFTYSSDFEIEAEYRRQALVGEISTYTMEQRYIRKNGLLIWVNLTTSLVRTPDGVPKYFISVIEDITRRKAAEDQLMHDAFHDALTGLPNRALFMDHLKRSLEHSKRHQRYLFAVLFLDLDRFQIINDSLGHTIGDQFLLTIAHRLQTSIRPGDTVARLGGDEFAILLDDLENAAEAKYISTLAQMTVSKPVKLGGRKMVTTASIGLVLGGENSKNSPPVYQVGSVYEHPEDILRDADTAMYQAKARGRARVEIFDVSMRAQAIATLELEAGLRRAIEQEEFQVHYQPLVSLTTGRITGVEALLRWYYPQWGQVYPKEFIALLEETGLIVPVGNWLLRTTCTQVKAWHAAGFQPLRVAVNMSVRQFQEQDLLQIIKDVLKETGLSAESLELEVTESIAMHNLNFSLTLLNELSRMGLHISIDDFGTGYSSLDRLKRLPINTLKIDQTFIKNLTSDPNDAAITTATIAMAHNLDLKVIAEGVETAEQLAFLQAQHCDEIQGYLFSRPVPAEDLTKLLQKDQHLSNIQP